MYYFTVVEIKSQNWVLQAKIKVSSGWAPSGGSREESFPASGGYPALHSLAHGSFLHLKAIDHVTLTSASIAMSPSLTLIIQPSSSAYKSSSLIQDLSPSQNLKSLLQSPFYSVK